LPSDNSYVCDGGNFSVSINSETLIVRTKAWPHGVQRQIPLKNVRSVVVERKSLVPVASSAILAGIIGVLVKYNALWFVFNLNSSMSGKLSLIAFLTATLFAVPTIERALFVNVIIASLNAETWRVRFVTSNAGKNLAAKFLEFSSGA
jgi:hypothetical protein